MNKEWNERFYREQMTGKGLERIRIREEESDLLLFLAKGQENNPFETKEIEVYALEKLQEFRSHLKNHIADHPVFLTSLKPLLKDPSWTHKEDGLLIKMSEAAEKAGVGPMAAVAGAISEELGLALQARYPNMEVMVENGGDIYLSAQEDWIVGVFAGNHPLSSLLNIRISKELMPLGICTSAGTVGPSLSFGKADAVVILSKDTALADAVATATGNLVSSKEDIQKAINYAKEIEGVMGVLIAVEDGFGVWGCIEFV